MIRHPIVTPIPQQTKGMASRRQSPSKMRINRTADGET
jgi:hypothetical protein